MKHCFMVLALFACLYQTLIMAADTGFGSLQEAKDAALRNYEPAYIKDLEGALYVKKLAPFTVQIDLTNAYARLVLLLTQRSYVSLAQITAQRTAILYFYSQEQLAKIKKINMEEYRSQQQAAMKAAIKLIDSAREQDCCGDCCCMPWGKKNRVQNKLDNDPSQAAQDAAIAAGLSDAAWGPAWNYGGDPWGPSWDMANDALITFFDVATAMANSAINSALVGITDPTEQGKIAYRVAEWVVLNYYYAKAIEMFVVAYDVIYKNLPRDAKNPMATVAIYWQFRDLYFSNLGRASKVYIDPWLKIYDNFK